MPLTQKQKPGKGITSKSNPERRARKYGRYKARSTCIVCNKLFKSPRKKAKHVCSGCQSRTNF